MYFAILPDGVVQQIMSTSEDMVIQEYQDRPEVLLLKTEGEIGMILDSKGDWIEIPKEYL